MRFVSATCTIFSLVIVGFCAGQYFNKIRSVAPPAAIEKHITNHLVVRCSDHRLRPVSNHWIKNCCEDDADEIALPGAAKCLAGDILNGLKFLVEKHEVKIVHLVNHMDCAGYGGSARHKDATEERYFHHTELQRRAKVVRESCPNVEVQIHLENLNGSVESLSL